MALGLPLIAFTAYSHRVARRLAAQTPTRTAGGTLRVPSVGTIATIAVRANRHLTWRRTLFGRAYGIGGFAMLVGLFMVLRALGIGPFGSLLAAGVGEETEEIDNLLTHQHGIVHSFGWYLRRFISDTRARGATPVVASRVPGHNWASGVVQRNKQDFALWAEQVARADGVAFLDFNELIAREYDSLGEGRVKAFFVADRVHTTLDGATLSARVVVATLWALEKNPVTAYLRRDGAMMPSCAR